MRMIPISGIAPAVVLFAFISLFGCGTTIPESEWEIDASGSGDRMDGRPAAEVDEDTPFHSSLQMHKHATITTELDTYDVRNVHFNTAQGFGRAGGLTGFINNTRFDIEKRFIDQIRVLGTITTSEARLVSHHYDMVQDRDLDFTFRTMLRKTDGERVEFIVRINRITGQLQEGGSLQLTDDELKSLKKIVFF